jgi:hypothetical protein
MLLRRAGPKAWLVPALLFLVLAILIVRSSVMKSTPGRNSEKMQMVLKPELTLAQRLDRAQMALKPGASLAEISDSLVHLAEVPVSALEADKAMIQGLESKLIAAQGVAARQEAIRAEKQRPAKRSPQSAEIDGAVTVVSGEWTCSATAEGLDRVEAAIARGDRPKALRTMGSTGSIALDGGMQVKVLDDRSGQRRVRVMTNHAGERYLRDGKGVFTADVRIDRECWVRSEALTR